MAIKLVETKTLTSAASRITFTSIPQTGDDLYIVYSLRTSEAAAMSYNKFTLNNNESGPYVIKAFQSSGATAFAQQENAQTEMQLGYVPAANATANTFGNGVIHIPNYTSSTIKTMRIDTSSENDSATNYNQIIAATLNTTAVTRLDFWVYAPTTFVANSTVSVYTITKGTGGTLTPYATGGTVTYTGGYFYHTFRSSGTFTPLQSLSAQVLVIGGGGGAGGDDGSYGGGGGGAGNVTYSAVSLTTTPTTVTVGAGGAGQTSYTGSAAVNGNQSSFGAYTANGGGRGAGVLSGSTYNAATGGAGGGGRGVSGQQAGAGGSNGAGSGGNGNRTTGGDENCGGGGGAGTNGISATTTTSGSGGAGINTYSSWATATTTGVSGYYAGGGGAGGYNYGTNRSSTPGDGGAGGGGAGGNGGVGTAGTANTGSGGGGGKSASGESGGSGIVIVRYPA